jgi:hypothetical protein
MFFRNGLRQQYALGQYVAKWSTVALSGYFSAAWRKKSVKGCLPHNWLRHFERKH